MFARTGFAATGFDEVAATAGITRAIVYRHFASKTDLYRAVLRRARQHLEQAVGEPPYTEQIIDDLLAAAAADPDGFRVLFHQASREPQFRAEVDAFEAHMTAAAHHELAVPDSAWARWAAQLAPIVTIAAITAWLDAGQPDPDLATTRICHVAKSISAATESEAR
jgi:AcrR family transcriptional regulator